MGLTAALVDRARVVGRKDTGRRVDGRKVTVDYVGPWFRARLRPSAGSEEDDQGQGAPTYRRSTSLLCSVRATDGTPIDIKGSDNLEVDCAALGGVTLWDVNGDPQPIRKRRAVMGYRVTLRRVEDTRTPQ